MATLSAPANALQISEESLKEQDRMMAASIQAIALERIKNSIGTLRRESNFQQRSMQEFTQAPLYIPKWQWWSQTSNMVVGTPPPQKPTYKFGPEPVGDYNNDAWVKFNAGRNMAKDLVDVDLAYSSNYAHYRPGNKTQSVSAAIGGMNPYAIDWLYQTDWAKYVKDVEKWSLSQKALPK